MTCTLPGEQGEVPSRRTEGQDRSTHPHTAAGSPRRCCRSEQGGCWHCGTVWKDDAVRHMEGTTAAGQEAHSSEPERSPAARLRVARGTGSFRASPGTKH